MLARCQAVQTATNMSPNNTNAILSATSTGCMKQMEILQRWQACTPGVLQHPRNSICNRSADPNNMAQSYLSATQNSTTRCIHNMLQSVYVQLCCLRMSAHANLMDTVPNLPPLLQPLQARMPACAWLQQCKVLSFQRPFQTALGLPRCTVHRPATCNI
jgi:hypothetical protein